MGKMKKKGTSGNAKAYLTRNEALRKLQVSLADFRRLCILKGVFPREPKKKVKGTNKTYYMAKDIMYLYHEPLLHKFREIRAFERKIKKATARRNMSRVKALDSNKPYYTIYHVIRERYPTFVDALRDLDDALTMVHLFASLPQTDKIMMERTQNCLRLAREWQLMCTKTNCLKKVFVSVKGYYYQAEIQGQDITWIVPHQFSQEMPNDVDYRVMLTFLEFYEVLLNFVNYKLYHGMDLHYPPKLDEKKDAAATGLASYVLQPASTVKVDAPDTTPTEANSSIAEESKQRIKSLKNKLGNMERSGENEDDDEELDISGDEKDMDEVREVDARDGETMAEEFAMEDEDEEAQQRRKDIAAMAKFKGLFHGCKVFIAREVPRHAVEFVSRCFGATVGWEGPGSPFDGEDPEITHHIVDRPQQAHRFLSREYIQPQWVFDSVNLRKLQPVHKYAPGGALPPHLSPFVDEDAEMYNPTRNLEGEGMEVEETGDAEEAVSEEDEEEAYRRELEAESKGVAYSNAKDDATPSKRAKRSAPAEETEEDLAKIMMTKKNKRLYSRMMHGINKKKEAADNLKKKREQIDRAAKKAKTPQRAK